MSLQPYNSWELVGGMEREGDKMGWGVCVIPAVPSHLGDLRAPGTTCPQGPLLTQGEPGPNRRGAAGGGPRGCTHSRVWVSGKGGSYPVGGSWGPYPDPGRGTRSPREGSGTPYPAPGRVQEEQERGGERG